MLLHPVDLPSIGKVVDMPSMGELEITDTRQYLYTATYMYNLLHNMYIIYLSLNRISLYRKGYLHCIASVYTVYDIKDTPCVITTRWV